VNAAADEHHLPGWPSPDGLIMHNADAVKSGAEFLRLLREILAGSGRTAGRVAAYSGSVLPRSTAYRFISPSNRQLPQYQDQVEAFLNGCGCHPATVDRMVEVWRRLGTGAIPLVHDALVRDHIDGAELIENVGSGQLSIRGTVPEPRPAGALRKLPSFAIRQDIPTLPDLAGQEGRVVVHGDLNISYHGDPPASGASTNGIGHGPDTVTRPGIEHAEPGAHTEFSISVFRLLEIRLKSGGNPDTVRRALLLFLILMVVFAVVFGGILATIVIVAR
jgi:hypothetical protein